MKPLPPLLVTVLAGALAAPGVFAGDGELAPTLWGRAAVTAGVEPATLYGIALQESGMRWDDGSFRPWPWTLNTPDGSMRFADQASAQAELGRLIRRGVRNIDVGLMQINLRHNGHRVKNPLHLLDPGTNLVVAASILRETVGASRTVGQGVARYHSWNPYRGSNYARQVSQYASRLSDGH